MDKNFEMPKKNATDEEIWEILKSAQTIAIVGLSRQERSYSYQVASYLYEQGYRIIPVNRKAREIFDEKSYSRFRDIPGKVDVVYIFQKIDHVPEIVESAIDAQAKIIWMPERIVDNLAADRARSMGLKVVMNKCMMKEHKRYVILTSM